MQPRQLAIVAAATVLVFLAAFGIGRAASGSQEATASKGEKAETIKLSDASVTAGVQAGAALPSLKAKPRKKPRQESESSTSTGSTPDAPSQSDTNTQTTQPPAQTQTQPQTQTQAPRNSTPKPSKPKPSNPEPPVTSGGGED